MFPPNAVTGIVITSAELTVGQTKGFVAIPKATDGTDAVNTGDAADASADQSIAALTNHTGDGLTFNVTGMAPGTVAITVTGHTSTGNEFVSTLTVTVTAPVVNEPNHFDFVEVPPM